MNTAGHAGTNATMGDLPLLKLVEVLAVAVAGGGFVWWQLRDVKRAQEASRRAREDREAREACEGRSAQVPQAPPPPQPPPP
ncbi:MAG: hypothetical protein LW862_01345 [Rubrivivax sp.]|nr:hypothetical protein [Rubrivivax sp.]